MTTKALRELLECIDDGELDQCSMGDHARHSATERGAEAIAAGWAVVRVPNELLMAARAFLRLVDQDALATDWDRPDFEAEREALRDAIANATGEDEPA